MSRKAAPPSSKAKTGARRNRAPDPAPAPKGTPPTPAITPAPVSPAPPAAADADLPPVQGAASAPTGAAAPPETKARARRAASAAPSAQEAEATRAAPQHGENPDEKAGPEAVPDWTARLTALLTRGPEADAGDLAGLWADHATGDARVDDTRLALLSLLARRQALLDRRPAAPDLAPLPAWPDADLSPLPALHPTGAPGVSLLSLCLNGEDQVLARALPQWLRAGAAEVVICDLTGQLAPALAAAGLADPRLTVAEVAPPGLSPAEGWNAAARLARCQQLAFACPGVSLPAGLFRSPPPPGAFRLLPGPQDGRGFLMEVDRRDLAPTGGFNEALPGTAHLAQELGARLQAQGLTRREEATAGVSTPAPSAPVAPGDGSLHAALLAHPALAALVNRHLASLLPTPTAPRAIAYAGTAALGPRLAPGPAHRPIPQALAEQARHFALCDLLAARLGPLPVTPGPSALALLLRRPAEDVTPLDAAVAASLLPQALADRRHWLLVDLSDCPPHPGARDALAWALNSARALGLSPVLMGLPVDTALTDIAAGLPALPPDPALAGTLWPVSLRDLAGLGPLPHARLGFDAAFLADHARLATEGPALALRRRPRLFIDAQHGLGNRLRAMASAAAIAEATGRELVVIWQPDAHCACSYEDLFFPGGAVLSEGFAPEARSFGLDLWNYMEVEPDSAKDAPIRLGATRDAYLRSAYPLVHPASTWASENRALRRFAPNDVVRNLVGTLGPDRPDLAVHIRMEGGFAAEHLPYESAANWPAAAHREIDHWRRRSHFRFFQARIDALVAEGRADRIFLASDTPGVYDTFASRYGDRLSRLPRQVTDRSAPAMVHAFADALLLSRAPRLLGSTFSSFTELAARLARAPLQVELSGRDF